MRPYLSRAGVSGNPAAAALKFCDGSEWKNCEEQSRCQQECAALRAKIGWPADLPCIDPTNNSNTAGTQWLRDFLSFAETTGWITENQLANQAFRCAPSSARPFSAGGLRAGAWLARMLTCVFFACNNRVLSASEVEAGNLCRSKHSGCVDLSQTCTRPQGLLPLPALMPF